MSTSTSLSLKAYMHEVRLHLRRYCVSLAYSRSDDPYPEKWKYGTGVLLKQDAKTLVLTAGHFASEVHSAKSEGNLEALHLHYVHTSEEFSRYSLAPDAVTEASLLVSDAADCAALVISDDLSAEIEKHGNLFFTFGDFLRGKSAERHLVLLCGYPVQANIITKNEAFLTKQDGIWFQYNKVKLGSLAFQSTLLGIHGKEDVVLPVGFDCEVPEHPLRPFFGNINSNPESGVTSAVGMSGGPVLAVVIDAKTEDAFFAPRLLGIQSRQTYIEWQERIEITKLTAVSSATIQNWIETVS